MRRYRLLSGVSGGLFASLTPIVALLALQPAEYGLFSIVYLLSAFGISLQYSVISEAWARHPERASTTDAWTHYSGALMMLSCILAAVGLGTALMISGLAELAPILGAAVLFTILRNGVRYFEMANESVRSVFWSDIGGILAFVIALIACNGLSSLAQVGVSWLAAGLFGVLALRLPRLRWGSGLIAWSRSHAREIKPLLADSLVMDAGAIGTPFLLAGFMGSQNFGIYRAVSNAALPVRLLVDPIRPALGRLHPRRLFSGQALLLLGSTTIGLSLACFVVLEWILPNLDFQLGTLSSLTPYAGAAAVFVAGNLLGSIFYISCRTNASPRAILLGRGVQTVLVVSMPILGFIWLGLTGAIWGFSISSVLSAAAWAALLIRRVPSTHSQR